MSKADSFESLWHYTTFAHSDCGILSWFRRNWCPKWSLSLKKAVFRDFFFFRILNFEFRQNANHAGTYCMYVPNLNRIRSAVWAVGWRQIYKQTSQVAKRSSASGYGLATMRTGWPEAWTVSSERDWCVRNYEICDWIAFVTRTWISSNDSKVWGLPEANCGKISKNSESTYIAKFCDLFNGVIGLDVR